MRTIVLACIVVSSRLAHADDDAIFVSAGLTLGAALHPTSPNGAVVGGELSAGVFGMDGHGGGSEPAVLGMSRTPYWVGGYADVVRDFGSHTTRLSIGPEAGRSVLGIDGGLLVDFGDTTRLGGSVRAVLTVAAVALYARYELFLQDSDVESHVVELGVLLKVPQRVHELR